MGDKLQWEGKVCSVQPRIRLLRSFDQRSHSYLGYVLRIGGLAGGDAGEITVAIGKAAHGKHQFQIGDQVRGEAQPIPDPQRETASYYRCTRLKVLERRPDPGDDPPPWTGVAPALDVYRERGHRRLQAATYEKTCTTCIWGCRMPVEIIVDQWNPGRLRHRFETFCYGPKSCPLYKAGATRKVPGRKGMTWEEEDWVDEEATAHRD